jgi:ATP-dependent Lhr-like helicase
LPSSDDRSRTTRTAGSLVVIVNGALAAYISRGARQLFAFLPEDEPALSTTARAIATTLARLGLLVHEVNGLPAAEHPLAPYLVEAGFSPSAMGFQIRHGGFGRGA